MKLGVMEERRYEGFWVLRVDYLAYPPVDISGNFEALGRIKLLNATKESDQATL